MRFIAPAVAAVTLCFAAAPAALGQTGTMRVSLPSPSAAALGKFGDVPVSLATGMPEIAIPIFTMQGRTLELPIAVRYHASGVRVEEIGGWAGIGWALEAGGAITRTVRGLVDETPNGYYWKGHTWWTSSAWPEPTGSIINDVVMEQLDGEPDQFFFSFAGRSGQFAMGPTSASPTLKAVRTIPYQKLRIVPNNPSNITSWEITSEDGTRYTFGTVETNTDLNITNPPGEIPAHYGDTYVSSWQLSKIHAPGGDSIVFHYSPYTATHGQGTYAEKFDQVVSNPVACVPALSETINNYSVVTQRLDSITSAAHTVRFHVGSALRTDALSLTGVPQEPRLDRISVTTPSGTLLREYQLEHDYSIGGRLTLRSVTEKDRAGNTLPAFSLQYESGTFPARTSFAQDHWGFHNGKASNTSLIPPGVTPSGTSLPGADRTPDAAASRVGALSRITYPTGGYTELIYEGNDYGAVGLNDSPPSASGPPQYASAFAGSNQGSVTTPFTVGGSATVSATVTVAMDPACGTQIGCPYAEIVGVQSWTTPGTYTVSLPVGSYSLHANEEFIGGYAQISVSWQDWVVTKKKAASGVRLAELRDVDAMGLTTTRKYRYLLPADTTRSSGAVSQEPDYDFFVLMPSCSYYSRSTTSKTPLGSGAVVEYRHVTVLHGAAGEFGRTEHAFRTSLHAPDAPIQGAQWPGARRTSRAWERGQSLGSAEYTAAGVVQQREGSAWAFHSDTAAQPVAVRRFRAMSINTFAAREQSIFGQAAIHAFNAFDVTAGWAYLSSDTTIASDEAGANALTTSRTYIYANAAHAMLTSQIETAPGGARKVTRFTYPADVATGVGDPEATALAAMNGAAHMPGALLERSVHDSTSALLTVQADLTTYRTTPSGQVLPYQTFVLDAPSPAATFTPSAVTSGVLTKDSRYVLQETAVSYDTFGRLLQLTDPRGKQTTYQYGGNPNAAFLTRVTRVKDVAGFADLSTELTWNGDGFLTRILDEAGRKAYFGYDLFGRLTERRGDDSVVVAQHAYAYSRTSANGWTFTPAAPNVVTTTTFLQQAPTPRSVVTQDFLDGLGRPIQSVVQGGSTFYVTATQYDAMGRPWRAWKPYSRTTAGYDAAFVANATGFYNSYHAVSNAKPYAETGYSPDALARVKKETPPFLGTTATLFRQFAFGVDVGLQQRYVEGTDESGKRTRSHSDLLGNPARSILGYGAGEATTTLLAHDVLGRRIQSTDPRDVISTQSYSTRGLVTSAANVDAGNVTREYDRAGYVRYVQDANQAALGQVLFTSYDFAGRPLVTGLGVGSLAALDPDAVTPPVLETTQSNWLTVNAYDAKPSTALFPWSLFTGEIAPLSLQRVAGRRAAEASRSNGAWQVTLFGYDAEGRLANRYQFTQDPAGATTWTALNTTAAYVYDLRGALAQRSLTVGVNAFHQWTDYDDRGLLWKLFAAANATKPATPDVTYTYRASGEPMNRLFAGGPAVPLTYTIRDQLERIGNPAVTTFPFSARYAYHGNETVSEAEFYQAGTPATAKRYRYVVSAANYDALNRLKGADFSSWSGSAWTSTLAYDLTNLTYDRAGNLTALRRYRSAATLVDQLTYTYPSGGNRLSAVTDAIATTAETWDAETGSLTYDANGNLRTAPAPYALTAATYDPWNRLLSITRSGTTTTYRSTASGHRLAQRTGSGPTAVTLREGSTVLGGVTLDAAGTPTAWHFNLLPGAQAVGRQPHTGARRYYHTDLLGSVRSVVTGATVVEATDYDPWGVVLAGRTLGSGTREGFTGQPRDLATGLDDFGARQYLSALGRWGGADPAAGVMPEWSPYAYVLDNPMGDTDVGGQLPWSKVVKLVRVVAKSGFNMADLAATFADNIQQVKTLGSADASVGAKAWAAAQLAITVLAPVDVSDVKAGVGAVRRVAGKADDVAAAVPEVGAAARLGGDAAQAGNRVHGNSGESLVPQHRYEIADTRTGDVVKTGISGQPLNKNLSSPRANRQVNALNREAGADAFEVKVRETDIPGRAAAKTAEQHATDALAAGGNSLREQKLPRPTTRVP